jgi:hypothetical protein
MKKENINLIKRDLILITVRRKIIPEQELQDMRSSFYEL